MTNEEILKGLYNAEFSTKEPEEPTMPIKMAMMVLGSYGMSICNDMQERADSCSISEHMAADALVSAIITAIKCLGEALEQES